MTPAHVAPAASTEPRPGLLRRLEALFVQYQTWRRNSAMLRFITDKQLKRDGLSRHDLNLAAWAAGEKARKQWLAA